MSPIEIAEELDRIAYRLRNGCGNHGCRINPPNGMGTNSICQCLPTKFAKRLIDLAADCEEQHYEWRKP